MTAKAYFRGQGVDKWERSKSWISRSGYQTHGVETIFTDINSPNYGVRCQYMSKAYDEPLSLYVSFVQMNLDNHKPKIVSETPIKKITATYTTHECPSCAQRRRGNRHSQLMYQPDTLLWTCPSGSCNFAFSQDSCSKLADLAITDGYSIYPSHQLTKLSNATSNLKTSTTVWNTTEVNKNWD